MIYTKEELMRRAQPSVAAAANLSGIIAGLQAYPATLVDAYTLFTSDAKQAARFDKLYAEEYAYRIRRETEADRVKDEVKARVASETTLDIKLQLENEIELYGRAISAQFQELVNLFNAVTQTSRTAKNIFEGSFNDMLTSQLKNETD